jgi:type IV pilus assembly protein PilN
MIKINLLPQKTRKPIHRFQLYGFLFIFVLNLSILGGIYYNNVRGITHYQASIESAKKEIASLDKIYKEYLQIEKEKKEIDRRIKVIEGLKEGRALAARTLHDFSSVIKERVWVKAFKKNNDVFEIEGRSMENESISDFIETISAIPYLKNVELKKVEDSTEDGLVVKKFLVQGNISL